MARREDDIVAKIGDGYGSECHLLRWMGRHRKLFDERVSATIEGPGTCINWLDFGFDPHRPWPDAELRGLEFLYNRPSLKAKWEEFWPTGGGVHNWDAVGWLDSKPDQQLLLLEAKAHVEEMKSDCQAKSTEGNRKIEGALEEVKRYLGASPKTDWMRGYYQAANRIATLYFLHQQGVSARLLFVYFLGDRVPGKECPRSKARWEPAIKAQWTHLGLGTDHRLSQYLHELFLPISEPLP